MPLQPEENFKLGHYPKSRILIPCFVTRTFAGFRSRCVMPFLCAASRASRICPAFQPLGASTVRKPACISPSSRRYRQSPHSRGIPYP